MKRGYFKEVDFDKFKEFAKDHTIKEIMNEYKLTDSKARFIVNHYNIEYKPFYKNQNRNYDVNAVLEARQKGETLRAIAKKFNIANPTVLKVCRKYGVEPHKKRVKKIIKKQPKPDVFEYAKKLCRKLNYADAFDYINKNGYRQFQEQITPILKEAIRNETVTTRA